MLEWESAGGRSTSNSRARILRCTCRPRPRAGRALHCKGGLRRARDKASPDSNKGGRVTDVGEREEFQMEVEEGAESMEGSESFDAEQGTIPRTARRELHSITVDIIRDGEAPPNPRSRGRQATTIKEMRDRESNSAPFDVRNITFTNFSQWILGPGYGIWHTTHKKLRTRQAFGYLASGTFIARCLPWDAELGGPVPRSFAGWTCGWLFYQGSSLCLFVRFSIPLRDVSSKASFLPLRFFDAFLAESQPGALWWKTLMAGAGPRSVLSFPSSVFRSPTFSSFPALVFGTAFFDRAVFASRGIQLRPLPFHHFSPDACFLGGKRGMGCFWHGYTDGRFGKLATILFSSLIGGFFIHGIRDMFTWVAWIFMGCMSDGMSSAAFVREGFTVCLRGEEGVKDRWGGKKEIGVERKKGCTTSRKRTVSYNQGGGGTRGGRVPVF